MLRISSTGRPREDMQLANQRTAPNSKVDCTQCNCQNVFQLIRPVLRMFLSLARQKYTHFEPRWYQIPVSCECISPGGMLVPANLFCKSRSSTCLRRVSPRQMVRLECRISPFPCQAKRGSALKHASDSELPYPSICYARLSTHGSIVIAAIPNSSAWLNNLPG